MDNLVERYIVVIQDAAAEMLLAHARFLAQVSETAANRLVEEFVNKAKTLKHFPERCPWLTDSHIPRYKYRKLIFEKRYMLIFMVEGETVFIDAMIDCREDYGWL